MRATDSDALGEHLAEQRRLLATLSKQIDEATDDTVRARYNTAYWSSTALYWVQADNAYEAHAAAVHALQSATDWCSHLRNNAQTAGR